MRPVLSLCLLLVSVPLGVLAQPWAWSYEGMPEAAVTITLAADEDGTLLLGGAPDWGDWQGDPQPTWVAALESDGVVRWAFEAGSADEVLAGHCFLGGGAVVTLVRGPTGDVLVALEADGSARWARAFQGGPEVSIKSLAPRFGGGIVVHGTRAESPGDEPERWTALLDADGAVEVELAMEAWGSSSVSEMVARETSDGRIILAGSRFDFWHSNYNYFVVSFARDGRLQWTRLVGGESLAGSGWRDLVPGPNGQISFATSTARHSWTSAVVRVIDGAPADGVSG